MDYTDDTDEYKIKNTLRIKISKISGIHIIRDSDKIILESQI